MRSHAKAWQSSEEVSLRFSVSSSPRASKAVFSKAFSAKAAAAAAAAASACAAASPTMHVASSPWPAPAAAAASPLVCQRQAVHERIASRMCEKRAQFVVLPGYRKRPQGVSFELSLRWYNAKADMAYRSRAHRHPAHSPHTRRPPARPAPAGRKGSDSLGRQQNERVC